MSGQTGGEVGIDQMGVYAPRYVLSLDILAEARDVSRDKILIGLGAHKMAVCPPWEDTVSLAANAAAQLFMHREVRPEEIGMLLVATETAVDHAKPVSVFLHDLLGLPASCRTFELKHACYGGTAGLMMAVDWIRSGAADGRKALVVATDIARYDLGSSAEFTQGAGAVALLLSEKPRLFELDRASGVFAKNVYDFWRPLDRREALVDGKFSVDCYLDALDGALNDYRQRTHDGDFGTSLLERFAAILYHTPFPKMAHKAHTRFVEHERRRMGLGSDGSKEEVQRRFTAQVDASLGAARLLGNTYTASLYFGLAWFAERCGAAVAGKDIGLFSYGSGCCAEFFSGRLAAGCADVAARIGLGRQLEARRELSVLEYESFLGCRTEGGTPPGEDAGFCHFSGVYEQRRHYERHLVLP